MSGRPRLRFRITLVLGLVLIVTVLSAVRLLTAVAWRQTLSLYMPWEYMLYSGLTGAFWMVVGLFVLYSIYRRERHSRWLMLGAALAYAAWAWADRLIVQSSLRADWVFDLLLTILLLAFVAAVGFDPRNQPYFRRETYERKPEESTTA